MLLSPVRCGYSHGFKTSLNSHRRTAACCGERKVNRISGLMTVKVQEGTTQLHETQSFRTFGMNLAIQLHQQLNGFQLGIVSRKCATFVDVFIGKIFDRMAQNLKRVSGFAADAAGPVSSCSIDWNDRRENRMVGAAKSGKRIGGK